MAAVARATVISAESPASGTSTTTAIQPRPCTRTPGSKAGRPAEEPAMTMRRIRAG